MFWEETYLVSQAEIGWEEHEEWQTKKLGKNTNG